MQNPLNVFLLPVMEMSFSKRILKLKILVTVLPRHIFILPKLQTKASFERTYRLPESTELLGDGLFTRRNPELRPESSYNLNVGVKYAFNFGVNHILRFEGSYILRKSKRLYSFRSSPFTTSRPTVCKCRQCRYEWF